MSTVAKREKKSKFDRSGSAFSSIAGLGLGDFDARLSGRQARVAAIQALIPLGLEEVSRELDAEVRQLAGERYQRKGRLPGHVRWTKQDGSVYLGDQKLPIRYSRVRDRGSNREVPLPTYRALQAPRGMDEGLLRRVLLGLSCGWYGEAVEEVDAELEEVPDLGPHGRVPERRRFGP